MKTATKIGIIVISLLLVCGCTTVPRGEEVEVVYMGSVTASNDSFQMEGYLSSGGSAPEQKTFRNVRIQLFEENGTPLCAVPVGDLRANQGRLNISLIANVTPEYVIITSPDFWSEKVKVNYFIRSANKQNYDREDASSRSELPVPTLEADLPSCEVIH